MSAFKAVLRRELRAYFLSPLAGTVGALFLFLAGTITAFAFDAGEGLSEHTAPFDAFVQVYAGEAEVTIQGKTHRVRGGHIIRLPANVPHAVHATKQFKMLLTMIRSR